MVISNLLSRRTNPESTDVHVIQRAYKCFMVKYPVSLRLLIGQGAAHLQMLGEKRIGTSKHAPFLDGEWITNN